MGCNGSNLASRLNLSSYAPTSSSEIVSTAIYDPTILVAQWLLDSNDNLLDKVIYNCSFTQVGLGLASHAGNSSSAIIVVDFTSNFTTNISISALPPMDIAFNCSANGYSICAENVNTTISTKENCFETQSANLPKRDTIISQINSVRTNPSSWI
jgi:hypothetical protein